MEDPMLIVTRLAYNVPRGREDLEAYLDESLTTYAKAVTAHLSGVNDIVHRMRSAAHDPTAYRSDRLVSLTEELRLASERFTALDREFARYGMSFSESNVG